MDDSFHRHRIDLSQPGQVIAAVPNLFGYHPADSVVVIALDIEDEDGSTCLALRVDLPAPDDHSDLGDMLAMALAARGVKKAILVVVGGTDDDQDDVLPRRELLARCERRFTDGGVRISHRLWASATHPGAQWRCYQHPDGMGVVPDIESTTPTAQVDDSVHVYPRRQDIEATLASTADRDTLATRADLVATTATWFATHDAPDRLQLVETAIKAAVDGVLPESDQAITALTVALSDHAVRDACIWSPDPAHTQAAERLWATLTRGAPAPQRAEPACLLAFASYQRGDGVLTGIALDIAHTADPQHSLTTLLRKALNLAVQPTDLERAGYHASATARLDISGARR